MPIISTSVIMGPTSLESNPQKRISHLFFGYLFHIKTLLCLLSTIDKGINLCKHYFCEALLDIDLTVLITSQFIMKLFVMFRQFLISCSRSRRRAVQTGVNTFITTLSMMWCPWINRYVVSGSTPSSFNSTDNLSTSSIPCGKRVDNSESLDLTERLTASKERSGCLKLTSCNEHRHWIHS